MIMQALIELGLFTAKTLIVFIFIFLILLTIAGLAAKSKLKAKGKLSIKNINHHFEEITETLLTETATKKEIKHYHKEKKATEKAHQQAEKSKTIYVIHFTGDIRASAVSALSEEVTAILNAATPPEEVIVHVESPGGVVHGYGLAAAQLLRIREKNIPLTVTIDKVAASGGYLMACVANQILAAPFAIIGSIGVIVQIPNFHRLLKEKHIDFEQLTAGAYKRTLTVFGENTAAGRDKMQQEINEVQHLFKNLITVYRPRLDINQVATGEHWLGQQALDLHLIDAIKTHDAYLLERSKDAALYEITYEIKKPLLSRLAASMQSFKDHLFNPYQY